MAGDAVADPKPGSDLNALSSQRHRESLLEKVPNPFENKAPTNCYERCKYLIVGVTLFPIRLVLFITAWITLIIICKIAMIGGKSGMQDDRGCLRHTEPLPCWRKVLLFPAAYVLRIVLFAVGFWWIKVDDRRKPGEKTPNMVVVAPHVNMFDAMLMAYLYPPLPSEVGKVELMHGPLGFFLGPVALAGQGIMVDRNRKESREACKEALAHRAHESWQGFPSLVFAEGTCTNAKALIQFKQGAFQPGKPVTPVALHYPYKHFSIAWTGDFAAGAGLGILVIKTMLQFINFAEVTIFEAYHPSPEEIADPQLFANNVRQKIADFLKVPVTEQSYADAALSVKAITAKAQSDFVVSEATQRYGFTNDELVSLLKEFKNMDKDRSGTISLQEFQKAWAQHANQHVQDERITRRLFQLFDTDQTGHLSYRELIQALAMLTTHPGEGQYKLCFMLCNPRDDGTLAKDQLLNVLEVAMKDTDAQVYEAVQVFPDEVDFKTFAELTEKNPLILKTLLNLAPKIPDPVKVKDDAKKTQKETAPPAVATTAPPAVATTVELQKKDGGSFTAAEQS